MTQFADICKAMGLTQKEACKLLGIPKGTLESYWDGRVKAPPVTLAVLTLAWDRQARDIPIDRVIRARQAIRDSLK